MGTHQTGNCVGHFVRLKRQERGLSARALSVGAGLSQSYVSKLEAGRIDCSLRAFSRLCVALQLTPLEVFTIIQLESKDTQ